MFPSTKNLQHGMPEDVWQRINEDVTNEHGEVVMDLVKAYRNPGPTTYVVDRDQDPDTVFEFFPRVSDIANESHVADHYIHRFLGGNAWNVGKSVKFTNGGRRYTDIKEMLYKIRNAVRACLCIADNTLVTYVRSMHFFPLMIGHPHLSINTIGSVGPSLKTIVDSFMMSSYGKQFSGENTMNYQEDNKQEVGMFIRYCGYRKYEFVMRYATFIDHHLVVAETSSVLGLSHERKCFTSSDEFQSAMSDFLAYSVNVHEFDGLFNFREVEERQDDIEW
jgi:hypothetical protein